MTTIRRLITAAALTLAAVGAWAQPTQSYTESFETLTPTGNRKYGDGGGTLSPETGSWFDGAWSGTARVESTLAPVDTFLVLSKGDAMTFNFTLNSAPHAYGVTFGFDLGGGGSQAEATWSLSGTGLTPSSASIVMLTTDLSAHQSYGPYSFTGLAGGQYALTVLNPATNAAPGLHVALDNFTMTVSAVPEPGTEAMMFAGLIALGATLRRRGARAQA